MKFNAGFWLFGLVCWRGGLRDWVPLVGPFPTLDELKRRVTRPDCYSEFGRTWSVERVRVKRFSVATDDEDAGQIVDDCDPDDFNDPHR
jgi:hypothetical protein